MYTKMGRHNSFVDALNIPPAIHRTSTIFAHLLSKVSSGAPNLCKMRFGLFHNFPSDVESPKACHGIVCILHIERFTHSNQATFSSMSGCTFLTQHSLLGQALYKHHQTRNLSTCTIMYSPPLHISVQSFSDNMPAQYSVSTSRYNVRHQPYKVLSARSAHQSMESHMFIQMSLVLFVGGPILWLDCP